MAKVVHITSAHPAFDPRIFHKEAVTLARAGHQVTLIAKNRGDAIVDEVVIKALPRNNGRLRRFLGIFKLVRYAMAERADVYHVHDPELVLPAIVLKFAGRARTVYDAHEDFPKSILSKDWIPRLLRRPVAIGAGAMERLGAGFTDSIVAATPSIARRFPSRKTVLVQNLPVVDEFSGSTPIPYLQRESLISYVGSITPIRGVLEIVRALSLLPDSLNIKLALAGVCSPPSLESDIGRLAGRSQVDFLGWQSRPEVGALLDRSRIGLVVLRPEPNYVDSQPTKLFEYMAAGLPVIASDFPRWREIVGGCGCGLLIDPLDPKALAAAIRRLLEEPEEARAMGERGRQAVHLQYNWKTEGAKLVELYERLTGLK